MLHLSTRCPDGHLRPNKGQYPRRVAHIPAVLDAGLHKVFWREAHSVCILYKRGHHAVFRLPLGGSGQVIQIDTQQLAQLLAGEPKKQQESLESKRLTLVIPPKVR